MSGMFKGSITDIMTYANLMSMPMRESLMCVRSSVLIMGSPVLIFSTLNVEVEETL